MFLVGHQHVVLLLVAALVLGRELVDGVSANGVGVGCAVVLGPVEAVAVDQGIGRAARGVVVLAPGGVREDGVGERDALEGGVGFGFLGLGYFVCGWSEGEFQ